MSKWLVLFVEGDIEVEFYKQNKWFTERNPLKEILRGFLFCLLFQLIVGDKSKTHINYCEPRRLVSRRTDKISQTKNKNNGEKVRNVSNKVETTCVLKVVMIYYH